LEGIIDLSYLNGTVLKIYIYTEWLIKVND